MMEVITVEQALQMENQTGIIILDLRPPEYYEQFHIDNAIWYSVDKIENGEYLLPKEYCMMLYCEHGGLSLMAARLLEKEGFCVKVVIGGMYAYRQHQKRIMD